VYYNFVRLDQTLKVSPAMVDRIEGFATEDEAGRWIKDESLVWPYNRSSKGEVAN